MFAASPFLSRAPLFIHPQFHFHFPSLTLNRARFFRYDVARLIFVLLVLRLSDLFEFRKRDTTSTRTSTLLIAFSRHLYSHALFSFSLTWHNHRVVKKKKGKDYQLCKTARRFRVSCSFFHSFISTMSK